jgi:hypothetical protein
VVWLGVEVQNVEVYFRPFDHNHNPQRLSASAHQPAAASSQRAIG